MSAFACWFAVSRLDTSLKIFIGYWSRELPAFAMNNDGRNYCVSWDTATKSNAFDGPWKFGKAVGILGALLSCFPFFLGIYVICYEATPKTFSFITCTNATMSTLSILLLAGLGSDICEAENCRIGPGGILSIVGFFLWLGATVISYKMRAMALAKSQPVVVERVPRRELLMIEDVDETHNDDRPETTKEGGEKKTKKKKKKKSEKAKEDEAAEAP